MERIDVAQKSYFGEDAVGVWQDHQFYVAAFQDDCCIRMDIVRHDIEDGITWDEIRKIKEQCGFGDVDAIEFYPAEKDIINTGNIRHIYIFNTELPLIRRKFNG